ncbi:MAG: hypothetical protein R6V12_17965 [Candidatus Hydrogenedentota bacterium]
MDTIERYKELREAHKSLNTKLLDSLPVGSKGGSLFRTAARELGYQVKEGTIVFSSEGAVDRLYEFLLYEPRKSGKSVAEKFLETEHDLTPDEEMILQKAVQTEPSLFRLVEVNKQAAQVRLSDILSDRPEVLITDINMSTTGRRGYLLFARILETPNVTFSSGTAMVFPPEDEPLLLKKYHRLRRVKNPFLRSRKRFALFTAMQERSGINIIYA